MVRCRAKGENYSYDFAASLQNTNEQSILISERDLTAWKGAAERMLTNEIVLKVFSDYLARDDDFEVVLTSKGYTVMGFDCYRQDWNTVDFCPTPEALRDSLLNAYESFRELEITGGDRDLTEKEEAKLAKERDALTALCEKEAAKCSSCEFSLRRCRLSCPCSFGCARGCCPVPASCSSWQADCSPCWLSPC